MTDSPPHASSSADYCAAQVRRFDHDRYLTALFAPEARRGDLLVLYAFNLEVAKTAEVVREPLLGEMRLQWLREAVAAIYEGCPPAHEVIRPLAEAVARRGLGRDHFETLIAARGFDLEDRAPADLEALEDYAEATSSSLLQLALVVLEAGAPAAREAGRHVGIAWALIGLLRALPYHGGRGKSYLPRDLSAAAGLAPDQPMTRPGAEGLAEVVAAVAARARTHLEAARRLRGEVPREAWPALALAVLAQRNLALLARAGYDPFHPLVQARGGQRLWRLLWARLRRRY